MFGMYSGGIKTVAGKVFADGTDIKGDSLDETAFKQLALMPCLEGQQR